MDSIRVWQSWFEYAENDLEAARILSLQVKPKYEIICCHCQQSAEKNLKGYIAYRNGRLQKTHDLVVLCETCATYDPDFEKIIIHCSDLTIFASEVRYPNILEIEDYHMQNAIKDAVHIKEFVLEKLTSSQHLKLNT
jgi:HEPN domain-containing protein